MTSGAKTRDYNMLLKVAFDEKKGKKSSPTRTSPGSLGKSKGPSKKLSEEEREDIKALFNLYDMNQDGYVDKFEFQEGLRATDLIVGVNVDELFSFLDTDNDGKVSQREFISYFVS